MSQGLLKMLILSGLKEALALTDATPLDLKNEAQCLNTTVHVNSVNDGFIN